MEKQKKVLKKRKELQLRKHMWEKEEDDIVNVNSKHKYELEKLKEEKNGIIVFLWNIIFT